MFIIVKQHSDNDKAMRQLGFRRHPFFVGCKDDDGDTVEYYQVSTDDADALQELLTGIKVEG